MKHMGHGFEWELRPLTSRVINASATQRLNKEIRKYFTKKEKEKKNLPGSVKALFCVGEDGGVFIYWSANGQILLKMAFEANILFILNWMLELSPTLVLRRPGCSPCTLCFCDIIKWLACT